jgi:hypothetical protein
MPLQKSRDGLSTSSVSRTWSRPSAQGQRGAVAVQVLGGRIQHRGTVEHQRIDKTLPGFGAAACRNQTGFGFCRLDDSSFGKLMPSGHRRPSANSDNQLQKDRVTAGRGRAGLLVTERRSVSSTP